MADERAAEPRIPRGARLRRGGAASSSGALLERGERPGELPPDATVLLVGELVLQLRYRVIAAVLAEDLRRPGSSLPVIVAEAPGERRLHPVAGTTAERPDARHRDE